MGLVAPIVGYLLSRAGFRPPDRDEDGWVSLDELYDYVFDKVQEQNPHQTPSRHFELEGELYVARSRRRRIRPAPGASRSRHP